jgi:hypothetical protein
MPEYFAGRIVKIESRKAAYPYDRGDIFNMAIGT